ncbi:hypothetical protein JCM6882_003672 [Rhodosporidiobolus microsporus]
MSALAALKFVRVPETEADIYAFNLIRRAHFVEMGVEFAQEPIKPYAPWLTFLAARDRLLRAFHAFERATREGPGPSLEDAQAKTAAVSSAFVQFSLALDKITVPHAYWSDLPHEDVSDGESHAVVLSMLNDLEKQFKLLTAQRALRSPDGEGVEDALVGLSRTLEKETALFSATAPCRHVARTYPDDSPRWPHNGSFSRA